MNPIMFLLTICPMISGSIGIIPKNAIVMNIIESNVKSTMSLTLDLNQIYGFNDVSNLNFSSLLRNLFLSLANM